MRASKFSAGIAAATLFAGASGHCQSYNIPWFAIDGGGGTSTGGVYSVSGTIGQADAGTMSGGNYALTGGFWSASVTVQTASWPELTIAASPRAVTILWPSNYSGFSLQQTFSLSQPNWTPVSLTVATSGTNQSVTVAPPLGAVFYRLAK